MYRHDRFIYKPSVPFLEQELPGKIPYGLLGPLHSNYTLQDGNRQHMT